MGLEDNTRKASLRVHHVASGDAWGGAERVVEELVAQSVHDSDLEVEVTLMNEGQLACSLRSLGVPVDIIAESQVSFWNICHRLRQRFNESRTSVVHAHRYKELGSALIAAFPRGRRVIVTVHGLEPGYANLGSVVRVWGFLLLARLMGAQIVCVSEELRTRISRALLTSTVRCIPNPMPAAAATPIDLRRQLGWPQGCHLVGFVGRLEPVKGPDLFLEVVRRSNPNLRFVLIGTGSMKDQLAQQISDDALTDRVVMLGEVKDARPYVKALDVVALTSRHEGTPMIVLEAAAAGIPVAAFNVGGVADLFAGCGATTLISPGDTQQFADAIQDLLGIEDAKTQAKKWGAKLADRLGPEAIVAAYKEVYRAAT